MSIFNSTKPHQYTDKEWNNNLNKIKVWFCNRTNHLFDKEIEEEIEKEAKYYSEDKSLRNENFIGCGLIGNMRMFVNEKLSELHWEGKHKEIKTIWGLDEDYCDLHDSVTVQHAFKCIRIKK